jgi:hypothetical protein
MTRDDLDLQWGTWGVTEAQFDQPDPNSAKLTLQLIACATGFETFFLINSLLIAK